MGIGFLDAPLDWLFAYWPTRLVTAGRESTFFLLCHAQFVCKHPLGVVLKRTAVTVKRRLWTALPDTSIVAPDNSIEE